VIVMDELKPCPFCGGEAKLLTDCDGGGGRFDEKITYFFWCVCKKCGAKGKVHKNIYFNERMKNAAINSWNRRAGEKDVSDA